MVEFHSVDFCSEKGNVKILWLEVSVTGVSTEYQITLHMANIAVKHSESERRKKALLYTAVICGILLLMFFLISWKIMPPSPPPPEQLIEVNLGNMEEGEGDVQPL